MRVKKRLKSLMLIDDHYPTNYYHELIIKEMGCIEGLITKDSAIDALDYFKSIDNKKIFAPNLVFLDIHMPKMNGWEFMDKYALLPPLNKAEHVIVMLSTTFYKAENDRIENNPDISGFMTKPLTKETIFELIAKYWRDHLDLDTP